MTKTVKAYFDRKKGFFTLNEDGKEIFKQLPARSGQRGFENTDWVTGKSPCPKGDLLLWLSPKDVGVLPKGKGIGEFYPISSGEFDRNTISESNGNRKRLYVGLHPENAFAGSAGCIVLLWDTPDKKAKMLALFKYLKELRKEMPYIQLEVF